ncbi:hypothetical protein B0H14DRAFT_2594408 [Mycena olivaceomarginata]|nr:hypothetical protein B0H14DRAFT_2594408 [Mycena olivaceomarginata]
MTDPLRVRRVAIAQGASAVLTTFHHLNRTYRSVSVSSPAHGHNTSIVDHLVVVPFCLEEAPTSLKTVGGRGKQERLAMVLAGVVCPGNWGPAHNPCRKRKAFGEEERYELFSGGIGVFWILCVPSPNSKRLLVTGV